MDSKETNFFFLTQDSKGNDKEQNNNFLSKNIR